MAGKPSGIVDILIVDDREDGLLAIEASLGDAGPYNLVKAHSGPEAVDVMSQYDFAMILLDVQMPGWDGFKTAEVIRGLPQYADIPILFVTAINKDERYVYRGYESGAVDYIFKPYDPVILRAKVAIFAELHLKNRQICEQARLLGEQEALRHQSKVQEVELEGLRRYRNLANAIPHMIWRANRLGHFEYFNQVWCDYTGLSMVESSGTGWKKAFLAEDCDRLAQLWGESQATGQKFEMECRIRRADGQLRWHIIRCVPERNTDGKVRCWIGACTDIEERKLTESRLIEAQKLAETANEAKTRFLANMSHEIRTPLNAIVGFSEFMLDPRATASEKLSYYSVVRRNTQHLLKLIDQILDISKVEANGLETERIEINVMDLLTEVRSLLLLEAQRRENRIEFRIEGQIPDRIFTDATRLRQILINVIGNALKFTVKGLVQVTVSFVKKPGDHSFLQFKVVDSGIGMDPSVGEKIFLPFSQADSSTTRIHGGTGLGLSLARKLAEVLGGGLWLDWTEPGKGSCFRIEIEAKLPSQVAWSSDFATREAGELPPSVKNLNHELEGQRILLVEDAEDNQILISRVLRQSGAIIDIASNGREGVEKALTGNYSAILMDIQMPFLDGYEATKHLRQAGYSKPIIALTAHALNSEREKCLKTGCSGHLTKPIDRRQLIESLVKFVSQS